MARTLVCDICNKTITDTSTYVARETTFIEAQWTPGRMAASKPIRTERVDMCTECYASGGVAVPPVAPEAPKE